MTTTNTIIQEMRTWWNGACPELCSDGTCYSGQDVAHMAADFLSPEAMTVFSDDFTTEEREEIMRQAFDYDMEYGF